MSNSIKAFWLGHSAFRFETPSGKTIYVDPFLQYNPKTPDSEKNPSEADYILLTHGHSDHVGDTVELAKKTGATVVGMLELIEVLKSKGLPEDQGNGMNKGGSVYFDDFKVTMVSANHSSSYDGQYTGEPAGLIIRFKDGYTVYHAGDTNIMYDMKIYGELYKPDIVFLPIGDHFTMGPVEAAYAAKLIGAKTVVPIHYGTWPLLIGTPEELRKHIDKDIEVLVPELGKNFLQ